ncbi:hypothetical protein L484_020599 [Morus notabilis]|uniref:Uncharacterized protein n=1 Tax=Morus notabilis TaxID=981085 RepID=W9SJH6_9ROSA|nr:hypothetical protein L484_020599 [Morus notabilis]
MIIKCKNQSRFSPVRNIKQTKLLSNLGRPNEKRIRNQTTNWRLLRRPNDVLDSLFHVSGEHMQQSSHELVVVERSVELDGEAIGDGAVAYVKPGVGEEIVAGVGLGLGGVVVDGVGADEGDGEALGGAPQEKAIFATTFFATTNVVKVLELMAKLQPNIQLPTNDRPEPVALDAPLPPSDDDDLDDDSDAGDAANLDD